MAHDGDDYHRLLWCLQPGGGAIHVSVVGPGPAEIVPSASIVAAKADVLVIDNPTSASHVQLRDYQRECVESIMASWERGVKTPLVVLPTASGKTIIAARLMELAYAAGNRSLFIAHRKELLDQTAEKIHLCASMTTPPRVGIVQASRNELGRDITIASCQTLKGKRLEETLRAGPYHVVFIDEAHHAPSKEYTRLIRAIQEHNPDVLLVGLTATPGRADGLALDAVFSEVCYQRSIFDMIDMGFLTPFRGKKPHLDIHLENVNVDGGEYDRGQLSKLLNTPHVNRAMVEAWREFGEDRKTLVFAVDVNHARALVTEFVDAGHAADLAYGEMKDRDRAKVLKRFVAGETQILVNVDLYTEGSDIPSIEAVMFTRPTASQGWLIQALGRGLRLYPGKQDCLVIDPVGNLERHDIIQLASLAGFDPHDPLRRGKRTPEDEMDGHDDDAVVSGVAVEGASDISMRRPKEVKYQWCETTLGWVLTIRNIGYYLVAWHGTTRAKATVRFYDQRPGRRNDPARDILPAPIDFEMAYGLVEGEMDRFFRARNNRANRTMPNGAVVSVPGSAPPEFDSDVEDSRGSEINFVDLDEGLDEDLVVPEAAMLADAAWRERPATAKQHALLVKLGGKKATLPDLAGEASDLINILLIERDAKMRMPATEKQIAYLRIHSLPIVETKGAAARLIWPHRKAVLEKKEQEDARFRR